MAIAKFILLVALSALIIMLGMPNIEQSRQEARNGAAFIQAQQIQAGELPRDTVDPWGNRFEIRHNSAGGMIVSSRGANMSTPADGCDSDDISSAMSKPPHKRTMIRKRIQIMATLALSASPRIIASVMLRRGRTARPRKPDGEANAGLK